MKLPVVLPVALGIACLISAYPAWWPDVVGTPPPTAIDSDRTPFGTKVPTDTIVDFRVAEWNDTASDAKLLEVKKDGNDWTVPSKFNYPADANTRVSAAASTYLGLERGRYVTDDAAQYEALGVLDPLDPDITKHKGRGKRVTLTDATGKVVADIIIGVRCPVGDGNYYVREKDAKKVYTAQVDPSDLSTNFTDYVEPDPLKIEKSDVRGMTIADYSVDLKSRDNQLLLRSTTDLKRQGTSDVWSANTAMPDGKQLAQGVINGILSAATAIKLTDVMLLRGGADLEAHGIYAVEPGTIRDNSPVLPFMDGSGQAKNYEIVGTEGRVDLTTKDGLVYSLMFGGAATNNDSKDKKAPAADAAKESHDRYVVVFVRYVPQLDEDAKTEPKKDPSKPEEAKKKVSGAERAAKAQKRFIKYFYVISDDAFKLLRPALDKLFENKPPEPTVGKTGKSVSAWLADNAKRPGVTTTADGLQYEILTPPRKDGKAPLPSDVVEMHYKGTLLTDDSQFDAAEGDKTFTTQVTKVIPAWIEMLQLMHEGEKVRIWARPELAYGEKGMGKIPPNATLVFEMEMLRIVVPEAPKTSALPAPAPAPVPAAPAATPAASAPAPAKPAAAAGK